MEITFDGEEYFLPKTDTVELLQSDGSYVTLFPSQLISGSATITVPPVTGPTTLTAANGDGGSIRARANGLSIIARPGHINKPSTGGLKGLLGLVHALESLVAKASTIAETLNEISVKGRLWAAGELADAAFGSEVGPLFDSATSDLSDFVGSMNGVFDGLEGEVSTCLLFVNLPLTQDQVYEMTQDGMRRVFTARTGSVEAFDILKALRKLLRGLTKVKGSTITTVGAVRGTLGLANIV